MAKNAPMPSAATFSGNPVDDAALLGGFDRLSGWLGGRWRIPGTGIRFGLVAVNGLLAGLLRSGLRAVRPGGCTGTR